jgi:ring-1,2-phenylacetyl-CoA epoxidase subunit PaaD
MVSAAVDRAREVASAVCDPELPFLTIADLGILRTVEVEGRAVTVTITPTYSGCPALTAIQRLLERRLEDAGFQPVRIQVALAPAWTSDWITEEGRRKLAAAGVAPPVPAPHPEHPVPLTLRTRRTVACPRCGSASTTQLSAFGATACKALHRCRACGEPFEYFKEI